MQDAIVIKSSKAGMTVILNPDLPFAGPSGQYCKKVRRQCPFLGKVQMTLTLEGRPTAAEEFQIVNTITRELTA